MRPVVFVMTDGSGRFGRSRLESTTRILKQVGASKGSFYGRLTDVAAYEAIINRDVESFIGLARELACHLIEKQVDYVAGDELEGYSPAHDICRLVIGAAVEMASRSGNRRVATFDFPLTGAPDKFVESVDAETIRLQLDDEAFARKMAAARSCAELESEIREAISQNRMEAFRVECLHLVNNHWPIATSGKPYYETYGEKQVAAGLYRDVIRYREHFVPLADALQRQAERGIGRGITNAHNKYCVGGA